MPKAKLNGVFDSYNSSKDVSAIPINIMTKGAFNCYVHNGEIKARKKVLLGDISNETDPTVQGQMYAEYQNDRRVLTQKLVISTDVNTFRHGVMDETISFVNLTPTITSAQPFKHAFANGVMYLSYGLEKPYKFLQDSMGGFFEPQGLPQPTTPSAGSFSTSGGSGGFEAGITSYVVTFVFKYGSIHEVEGEVSDIKSYTTTTSGTGRVVNMVVTQPLNNDAQSHITHFNVYRRHPSQDTYYFVEQVAFTGTGSTQNYTDNDGAVFDLTKPAYETNDFGNEVETNTQLTDPHYGIEWHQGRMWYASTDGRTLHYSEAGLPESVRLSLTIGAGGDRFTQLISLGETMLIVKINSIWLLTGDNITNFEVNQIASFGSLAHFVTFYYDGHLYGIDSLGLWRWNLSSDREILNRQLEYNDDVTVQNATEETNGYAYNSFGSPIEDLRFTIEPETGYIWFSTGTTNLGNLGFWVYDPRQNKFVGLLLIPHTFVCLEYSDTYGQNLLLGYIDVVESSSLGREYNFAKYGAPAQSINQFTTEEDDFPIRIQLGMLPNLDASVGEYLWRYLKWYFAEFPDENWSLKVLVDGSEVTIDNSINFGTTNKHEIGRSGEELSLIFESTASEGGVRLTKLELDYEETNQW